MYIYIYVSLCVKIPTVTSKMKFGSRMAHRVSAQSENPTVRTSEELCRCRSAGRCSCIAATAGWQPGSVSEFRQHVGGELRQIRMKPLACNLQYISTIEVEVRQQCARHRVRNGCD